MTRAPGQASGARRGLLWVLTLTLPLLALEGLARAIEVWVPARAVDVGLGFYPGSRVFSPVPDEPAEMTTAPAKRVAFRTAHFSAVKLPRTLRIFVLGESSVHQLQDELDALRRRLRTRLRPTHTAVEIINAGGLSYGSQRLVPVAREILEYQPDVLFVYIGNNEFEEVEQLRLISLQLTWVERFFSHLALFRVMRDRFTDLRLRELEQARDRRLLGQDGPDTRRAWSYDFTPRDADERMDAFRRNLASILTLYRDQGIPVILGTVPSNRFRPRLPPKYQAAAAELQSLIDQRNYQVADVRSRQILREAAGRHQSSDRENEIIRELARSFAVPLADVEQAIIAAEPHGIPGESLFEDHCHLAAAGRTILVATLEVELLGLLGVSPPENP